jgi:hypothetical protein
MLPPKTLTYLPPRCTWRRRKARSGDRWPPPSALSSAWESGLAWESSLVFSVGPARRLSPPPPLLLVWPAPSSLPALLKYELGASFSLPSLSVP